MLHDLAPAADYRHIEPRARLLRHCRGRIRDRLRGLEEATDDDVEELSRLVHKIPRERGLECDTFDNRATHAVKWRGRHLLVVYDYEYDVAVTVKLRRVLKVRRVLPGRWQ